MQDQHWLQMRFALALLLLCCPAFATFTQVQFAIDGTASNCGLSSTTSCTINGSSTTPLSTTGTGNVLVALYVMATNTSSISAVSGGGTWQHSSSCLGSFAQVTDCWYVLSSTATSSITATGTTGKFRGGTIYEYSFTGASAVFDAANNARTTSCTTCAAASATLTGTNDVIFQVGNQSAGNITAISTYGVFHQIAGSQATAVLENSTSGAAPNWTVNSTANVTSSIIAIAEVSASRPALLLRGVGE